MISCSLEDGKRNVVGPAFVVAMNDCLDRADADKAKAIVLEGRAGTFSAGFDLKEFQKGSEATLSLVRSGFEMLLRLFEFPRPVVAACSGDGIGMGTCRDAYGVWQEQDSSPGHAHAENARFPCEFRYLMAARLRLESQRAARDKNDQERRIQILAGQPFDV